MLIILRRISFMTRWYCGNKHRTRHVITGGGATAPKLMSYPQVGTTSDPHCINSPPHIMLFELTPILVQKLQVDILFPQKEPKWFKFSYLKMYSKAFAPDSTGGAQNAPQTA